MTEATTSDWVFGVKELNAMIQDSKNRMPDKFSAGDISDGYHTFDELYVQNPFWVTRVHSDGTPSYEGYFLAGLFRDAGVQITYHIPDKYWYLAAQEALICDIAPCEFDGHTSADVLKRLGDL